MSRSYWGTADKSQKIDSDGLKSQGEPMKTQLIAATLLSLAACSSPINAPTELNAVDLETPDLLESELLLAATPTPWTGLKDVVTDFRTTTSSDDITTDANSNVFIPVTRNRNNTPTPDFSLVKLNPGGNIVWTVKRAVGAPNFPDRLTVATDPAGNVYLAGNTGIDLEGQRLNGQQDAFVTKYNTNGKIVWTRLIGASADDGATGIGVDSSGEVYVSGWTCGTGLRLGGNVIRGGCDMFVMKFSNGGARRWVQLIGTNGNEQAGTMSVAANGIVAVTGNTNAAFPGFTAPAAGSNAAFAAKLSSSGTIAWVKQFNDTTAKDVAVDSTGDAIIYSARDVITNGIPKRNYFLRKLRGSDGQLLWTTFAPSGVLSYSPSHVKTGPGNKIYVSYTYVLFGTFFSGASMYSPDGLELSLQIANTMFDTSFAFRGNNLYTAGYTQSDICSPTPFPSNQCNTIARAAKFDLNLVQQ
jgi:Beta-propeller repeat